jgi:hypothetical protein
MAIKTDVIFTSTDHGLETGEEVYYAGEVYYARVLDARSLILYADTALTTVVTSVTDADTIISRDDYPDIDLYSRSRFTDDGRGVLGAFIFETSITTNITNYNIATAATAAGWDGNSIIYATITVAAGVYVYATTTGTAGLSTGTGYPDNSKIEIINNGFIIGKGGDGYVVTVSDFATGVGGPRNGNPGGPAMNINYAVTITNNSYIAGGGGAGNTAVFFQIQDSSYILGHGGGGAGGGRGGGGNGGNSGVLGAAGGGPGQIGGNGWSTGGDTGGGGGRILPGVGGAGVTDGNPANGGGAGGGAGYASDNYGAAARGAGGGGWGAAGGSLGTTFVSGSGGSANNPGGASGVGAAGGKAINLNGNAVTFNVTGTVWGAVS